MTTTTTQARNNRGSHPHLVPITDLRQAILDHLKAAPRFLPELSSLVGYSANCVRARLLDLESEGRVHRIQVLHPQFRSKTWVWYFGAGEIPEPILHTRQKEGNGVQQITVSVYPAIGRRDPLVAALFGNVYKEAA